MNPRATATVAVVVIVVLLVGVYAGITYLSPKSSMRTTTSTSTTTSISTVTSTVTTSSTPTSNSVGVVNIGYFANLNHAQAVIGLSNGDFQNAVGPSTKIVTQVFSAGPTEMTALLAGDLDMAFVGPDPAVNAYIASNGTGLEILAGVASGGAEFVVTNSSGITSVKDLGGKTFAAPQAGNTQDVALRHYLQENGYSTTTQGGNVTVVDTSNSNIVTLFTTGKIDGAWVPQPWAAILISDGGRLFLNEQSLWPNGQFSTAVLVVRTAFLQAHPDVVREIVSAEVTETIKIDANLTAAAAAFNAQYAVLTGAALDASVLASSLTTLQFTYDPLESTILQQAQNEYSVGYLTSPPGNLDNLFDLSVLNSVLIADGLATVTS